MANIQFFSDEILNNKEFGSLAAIFAKEIVQFSLISTGLQDQSVSQTVITKFFLRCLGERVGDKKSHQEVHLVDGYCTF